MAEAGSAPLGYALPLPVPFPLIPIPIPTPETPTPSSPPGPGVVPGPQWWDLGRGPDTSGYARSERRWMRLQRCVCPFIWVMLWKSMR